MAGTNVGAVYLDFRLDTRNVVSGFRGINSLLEGTRGRFDGLLRGVREFGVAARGSFSGASREVAGFGASLSRVSGVISSSWDAMLLGMGSGWESVWRGITTSFGGFINRIAGGFNSLIAGINRISLDVPSWLGGGRMSFNLPSMPSIPALARGGIVSAPTLALVGERGREAVLPLENNTGWMADMANMLVDAMGGRAAAAAGGVQRVVLELDGAKLADVLVDELEGVYDRRGW